MNIRRAAALASLASLLPFSGGALAQTAAADSNSDLRAEIEEQKQRLAILERKLENQQEALATAAASAPKITANASRVQIGSTDGANFIRLRGTLFADNRAYAGDSAPETADTFILRSVRPTIEGTFGNIYDFRFTPDFGSGRSIVVDAYAAACAQLIGADWLFYQDLEDLIQACVHDHSSIKEFDTSCFSGQYVTGDVTPEYLARLQSERSDLAKATRRDADRGGLKVVKS